MIYSLIYQESRFAAHAYSTAGASGLMQLMPATAAQIASEIGYPPNYTQADLSVPLYNLELGSNYLARQFYVFEGGDPYHALAAYNGGPGNTFIWKNSPLATRTSSSTASATSKPAPTCAGSWKSTTSIP